MAMNNSLAEVHPELVSEWSEKNLPLKPDEVNAKSRKNVWWRCGKCGNEWKSVINARVKGTVCPVCAEREVLAGYNDLATTDNQLLSEWDYEQNKLKPTEVSRTSAKRAWWKCRHGHSLVRFLFAISLTPSNFGYKKTAVKCSMFYNSLFQNVFNFWIKLSKKNCSKIADEGQ